MTHATITPANVNRMKIQVLNLNTTLRSLSEIEANMSHFDYSSAVVFDEVFSFLFAEMRRYQAAAKAILK